MTSRAAPLDEFIPADALAEFEARRHAANGNTCGTKPAPPAIRVPYPPDNVFWTWTDRQRDNWLRWRDKEEKRRGLPGPWNGGRK